MFLVILLSMVGMMAFSVTLILTYIYLDRVPVLLLLPLYVALDAAILYSLELEINPVWLMALRMIVAWGCFLLQLHRLMEKR